ncbi:rhamnogalacturonyl hydrolase YesR [Paenibacillus turicensis]|uniref:Rhamnogalacturonyl hydrolase YesR n=1 Tax=Paenibacillus turicensis TaxID=160487 RepID=A0ABS4FWY2_9BACL|nr:hypothetical protein [Paenibacillus turicensis]MBP1907098.1 rhamnogalacturonyl hydrolase YesR [Paenibacillus turicensis]
MNETVKAKSYWVWTEKAEQLNPNHSRAGEAIWYHHKTEAPKAWLDEGLIIDSSKFVKEGQTDIFDFL